MKNLLLLVTFPMFFSSCDYVAQETGTSESISEEEQIEREKPVLDFEKTRKKAAEALVFCKAKKYNTDFCILMDFSLHSGVNRLVVWDFAKDTFDHICLVGHGSGDHPWNNDFTKEKPKFSNEPESHCSSLGKYRIGERAPSDWGVRIKYVIHGLESTNNNAARRYVVFHSWERVPDEEMYPSGTPEGWGCPIVSLNNFMLIDEKLRGNSKSTLMWIYV